MPDRDLTDCFRLFTEIGIIEQLSRNLFEARLPRGFLLPHFSVLNHLVRVADGRTPLALARAFQVPKTTMSHTLLVLERAGLVETRPNPDDGRSKRVWITEAGRNFRDTAIAAVGPDLARVSDAIAPDRIAGALPLLEELRRFLDTDRDGDR